MPRPLPPALAPTEDQPPFEDERLEEFLRAGAQVHDPEQLADELQPVGRWQIEDDGAAEWAMRMLAAIELEAAAVELQYREWLAPIERWRGDALGRIAPRAAFFRGHLERWGLRRRAEDPKVATLRLPSGEVATRRPSEPRVELVDEDEFLAWAGDNLPGEIYEQVVKISQSVLIGALRKVAAVDEAEYVTKDGCAEQIGDAEIVRTVVLAVDGHDRVEMPGLVVAQPETTATVKPSIG